MHHENIIITYYPTQADNNTFYSVLFDIFTTEKDLAQHNAIVNKLVDINDIKDVTLQ